MRPSGSHERRKPLARTRAARVHSPPSLSSATPVLKSSLKHEREGSSKTSKHVVEDPPSSSPALNLNLEDASFGSQADGSSSAVQPLVELDTLLVQTERIEKLTLEEASAIDDLKGINIDIGLQDNQASGEGSCGTIKHHVEDPLSCAAIEGWFLELNRRFAELMQIQKTVVVMMRKMELDTNASKQPPSGPPNYDIRVRFLLKVNVVLARWAVALRERLPAVEKIEKRLAFKLAASSSGSASGYNQASGEGSSGTTKHDVEDPLSSAAPLTLEDASAINDLKGWFLKFNRRLAEFKKVQKPAVVIMRKMEADMCEPQYDIWNRLLLRINLLLANWTGALWARLQSVEEMEKSLAFKLAATQAQAQA